MPVIWPVPVFIINPGGRPIAVQASVPLPVIVADRHVSAGIFRSRLVTRIGQCQDTGGITVQSKLSEEILPLSAA